MGFIYNFISLLFVCAVCFDDLPALKDAVIQSLYASFKGQMLLAEVFKKHHGRV